MKSLFLAILVLLLSVATAHADTFVLNAKESRGALTCTNIMAGGEDDTLIVLVPTSVSLSLFSPFLVVQKIGTLTGNTYLVPTWKPHCSTDTTLTVPVYGTSAVDSGSVTYTLKGDGGSAYHRLSFRDSTGVSRDSLLFTDGQRWPQEYYPFTLPSEITTVGGDFVPPISGAWELILRLNGAGTNYVRVITVIKLEKK